MSVENPEISKIILPKTDSLETFFTNRLAEELGVDPSEITPELLEQLEQNIEFDARPSDESISLHPNQNFLTHREILERRARCVSFLSRIALI